MPFFDAPVPPAMPGRPAYEDEVVKRWTEAIAASDGFIIVSPEYNHGPSAVLKNAIDWVYPEWSRKAVTFVGYGSVGGARAIEQLREIAVEMQLAPIRSAVHVPAAAIYAPGCRRRTNDRRPAVVDQRAEDRAGKMTMVE